MNINLNKSSIIVKTIKAVITLIGFSLFIGCENPIESQIPPIIFELDAGLIVDSNGYYHLPIDITNWQTLHRLSGRVTREGSDEGVNVIKFGWASNLYWEIGDTLGYIVESGLTDDLEYVSYDTNYVTWFDGDEVPIINSASYSDYDGYVNTMMAPVRTMIGDTATIYYGYWDNWTYEETYGEFHVIFD